MTTPPTTTPPTTTPPTLARALASRPSLLLGEADTFLLLEALCGHRRSERWEAPPTSSQPSATLAFSLARSTGIGLLRFLVAQGAERDDDVLRGDRRVSVALSRSDDDDAFSLAVSSAWPGFIEKLSTTIMPLARRRREVHREDLVGLGRTERQHLRLALPTAWRSSSSSSLTVGDHLAFAMAVEHVARLGLPEQLQQLVVRSVAATSPLAALYQLDDPELGAVDVASLCRAPLVRAFELTGPGASRAWVRQLEQLRRLSGDGDELVARVSALTTRLRQLLRALDAVGRLDLAGFIADFAAALPTALPIDTRALLIRLPGVAAMSDRDRVVGAVAAVFHVVDDLEALGGAVADSRYGDERWTEAGLVRGWLGRLRSARTAIDASRQALVGAIG